ncbi:MAG: hypothetical protein U0359_04765 [Byssovorax sp.]
MNRRTPHRRAAPRGAHLVAPALLALGAISPPAAAEDPPAGDKPEVVLRSTDPRAILERRPAELDKRGDLAGNDGWVPVCIAPCGSRLGRIERLRVAGSGVDPSDPFVLPPGPGPFTVQVSTGSASMQTAGLTLVIAGGGLLGLGGFSLIGLELTGAAKNVAPDSFAARFEIASITTLILSAVVLGVAAPFRFSERTTVQISPTKTARRGAPAAVIGPGWVAF